MSTVTLLTNSTCIADGHELKEDVRNFKLTEALSTRNLLFDVYKKDRARNCMFLTAPRDYSTARNTKSWNFNIAESNAKSSEQWHSRYMQHSCTVKLIIHKTFFFFFFPSLCVLVAASVTSSDCVVLFCLAISRAQKDCTSSAKQTIVGGSTKARKPAKTKISMQYKFIWYKAGRVPKEQHKIQPDSGQLCLGNLYSLRISGDYVGEGLWYHISTDKIHMVGWFQCMNNNNM